MADIPRLNGVIRALEQGQHAFTAFSPADVESAIALAHVQVRRRRVRDGAQRLGRPGVARLPAVHAEPAADRPVGLARARRDADGAHPAERRREGAVARQAGARPRRLRHRLAAHQHRRAGLQRGRGLPLSAPQGQADATSRPASAATGRPRPCATGASPSRNTTTAPTCGRSIPRARSSCILHDRGHRGHREPRRHAEEGAGHRRRADRRGRSQPGARLSAPVRAPGRARGDGARSCAPARSTTWWSAIRTWRPATPSASSRRATAS